MAPKTMRAAVCKEAGKPLVIEDIPVPKAEGRKILVRVKVASLCHSDLSIISGAFGAPFPLVPGHEAISVVEEIGEDAKGFGVNIGDLIGAPLWEDMCLTCNDCVHHGAHYCTKMGVKGFTLPGYFSEYTLVDAASAVVVEKATSSPKASASNLAPLFCAGITVWDALERTQPAASDTIAVIGAGGLGAIAVQYLHAMGIKVLALDVRDEQLKTLEIAGVVDGTINTRGLLDEQLVGKVLDLNGGKAVDTALVTSGVVPAYHSAFPIIKPQGKVIAVGLPHQPLPLNIGLITSRCTSLIGAKVPGKEGSQRCLDFTVRKGLYPKINPRKFKLEDINEMLKLMQENKVEEGRMVIEFF